MFCDWSHMNLKEDVMKQMQEIYERKFMDSMCQDPVMHDNGAGMIEGGFDNEEEFAPMKLIDLKCWCKITYTYGVIGPEIMFFCQEKNQMMSSL